MLDDGRFRLGPSRLHCFPRNLRALFGCQHIGELDEQWDFIAKKQRHVTTGDPDAFGDVWLFVALAATQKAVLSYVVGKRSTENTEALAMDLRARIVNRPQITSDGYTPYPGAVEAAFGWDVDFAQLTKEYVSDSSLPDAAHRYSPGHVSGVQKDVIRGILRYLTNRPACSDRPALQLPKWLCCFFSA